MAMSEWRLSFIVGKANRTIVLSSEPIRVPSTIIARIMGLLGFGEAETGFVFAAIGLFCPFFPNSNFVSILNLHGIELSKTTSFCFTG
jgi:hypothetical protein